MIKPAEEIRLAIRELWPGAVFLHLPDQRYFVADNVGVISAPAFPEAPPPWWDCNHYALQVYAHIHRTKLMDGAAWAYGMAFGTKFHGMPMAHTVNILYAINGFYLDDWKTGKHWIADRDTDDILTVIM